MEPSRGCLAFFTAEANRLALAIHFFGGLLRVSAPGRYTHVGGCGRTNEVRMQEVLLGYCGWMRCVS
jgi:hypothetical protein